MQHPNADRFMGVALNPNIDRPSGVAPVNSGAVCAPLRCVGKNKRIDRIFFRFMVWYDPDFHHRRSIRLRGYDYRQAASYFVTICVQHRECLFGEIEAKKFNPNLYGEIVARDLALLDSRYSGVNINPWVVMPNHIHFNLEISADPRDNLVPLGEIVRSFKYETTKKINLLRESPGVKVWQRNYYEHIIRNEAEHQTICNYIHQNPLRWNIDLLHPQNPSKW
jgi:putative transposase